MFTYLILGRQKKKTSSRSNLAIPKEQNRDFLVNKMIVYVIATAIIYTNYYLYYL